MLLSLLLAAVCIPGTDEFAQYTPSELFKFQIPYRFHIQTVEVQYDRYRGGYIARTTDYYADRITKLQVDAPVDPRMPRGSVTYVHLEMQNTMMFPENRCARYDVSSLTVEGAAILTITDRERKEAVWPQLPPDP